VRLLQQPLRRQGSRERAAAPDGARQASRSGGSTRAVTADVSRSAGLVIAVARNGMVTQAPESVHRRLPPGRRRVATFHLLRYEDESGVSGTGWVAEGAVFSNGWVALTWLGET